MLTGTYKISEVKINGYYYYLIKRSKDYHIMEIHSKYLKHKTLSNCSPNTVKKIAYALSYYLAYMDEKSVNEHDVFSMKYSLQYEHFTGFLAWIKAGNHTDRDKTPDNNTCNSYLKIVFGFYFFLTLEHEEYKELKVFDQGTITGVNATGVGFRKNISLFKGYLDREEHYGKTIEKDSLQILLDSCSCIRNQLLILLLAETGLRIGELLGIRYAHDIDLELGIIKVVFRPDNENRTRAKNAEYRRAHISAVAQELLSTYIYENRSLLKDTEYLFINLSGKTTGSPMTVNGVYSFLRTLEKQTGIKSTPHMLRHYFANERRKAGWDLLLISRALGHKHISTTERYLHIDEEELLDASTQFLENNSKLYDFGSLL